MSIQCRDAQAAERHRVAGRAAVGARHDDAADVGDVAVDLDDVAGLEVGVGEERPERRVRTARPHLIGRRRERRRGGERAAREQGDGAQRTAAAARPSHPRWRLAAAACGAP